ncbi:hypothetical protein HRR83_000848 [Exophiala dermatitidis]|uniref:Uncharacterized protein n=1 Tax=Exophiala dermatitidis TaxID=5970 RepID=A0AAN6IYI1_EXODE|nr:hypothetical protein HRR75_000766 [Exophiala dermatitidis]KAJ4528097.1 hypothetical protein HRR74_000852 [Exophiala dermatitidis]KAJ4528730.1 hypothetical protein HRR73_001353 [Exophiala dermatitidis]KAJ4530115.1 hypothetical protein HRR76_009349 [Exophiala dermatitidis]KAJ4553063.1 hypothetical protein HRR78_003322 [Exophiala dermatitidis]
MVPPLLTATVDTVQDRHLTPEEIDSLKAKGLVQSANPYDDGNVDGKIKVSALVLGPPRPSSSVTDPQGDENGPNSYSEPTTTAHPKPSSIFTSTSNSDSTLNSNSSSAWTSNSDLSVPTSQLQSRPSATVRPLNFKPQAELAATFFDLPTNPSSVAALEFLGFTSSIARAIYDDWLEHDHDHEELIAHVYKYVENRISDHTKSIGRSMASHDVHHDSQSMKETMRRLGLGQEFQDALTDERFADIFWTESLHAWVKDTLWARYASLVRLLGRVKRCGGESSRRRRDNLSTETTDGDGDASGGRDAAAATHMTLEEYGLPSNYVSILQKEQNGNNDSNDNDNGSPNNGNNNSTRNGNGNRAKESIPLPPVLPDHIVLYKGKAAPPKPFIRDSDGSIDMAVLASSPGGDFNHNAQAHYWTPDREVAEKYRGWAARRCPYGETWVIRMQISQKFIETLNVEELWLSDYEDEDEEDGDGNANGKHVSGTGSAWKEYVWHCKNQITPPEEKFGWLWKQRSHEEKHVTSTREDPELYNKRKEGGAGPGEGDGGDDGKRNGNGNDKSNNSQETVVDVIKGHMCTGVAVAKPVSGIKKEEVHTEITEDFALRVTDGAGGDEETATATTVTSTTTSGPNSESWSGPTSSSETTTTTTDTTTTSDSKLTRTTTRTKTSTTTTTSTDDDETYHDVPNGNENRNGKVTAKSKTRKAVQWVFMRDETIRRLAEEIRGKVHIDIYGPTAMGEQ